MIPSIPTSYIKFNQLNRSFLFWLFNLTLPVLSLSFVELETKRILLDIFKEKQQKSAEAGSIPSFYKKASVAII